MGKVILAVATGLALSLSGVAAAAPLRVAIASFAGSSATPATSGALVADELADRLALVPAWAVTDREHVREAETALGWKGGDADLQRLTALGKRLRADVVVGADVSAAGDVHAIWLSPADGKIDRLEAHATGGRADRVGITVAKALIAARHADAPALSLASIEAIDGGEGAGGDAAYAGYARGRALFFARSFAAAQQALAAAVAAAPKLGRAAALLAYTEIKLGAYDKAGIHARAALEADPNVREVRLTAARADDYADHVDAAIDGYRATLALAPGDAVAHSNLARLLAAKKRDQLGAFREYEAAVAAEPEWTVSAFNLALSEIEIGRAADAVTRLERLHQQSPAAPELSYGLGRAYRRAGRPASAVSMLGEQLARQPGDVASRVEYALALADDGKADAALEALGRAPAPAARLQTARVRVLAAKGDVAGAIALGTRAVLDASARDRHELERVVGVLELESGDTTTAAKTLARVVDEDPLDVEALYNLGVARHLGGAAADGDAAVALARAHAAAPYLVPVALALSSLALERGDAAGAARTLGETLAAGGNDARLHLALGLARWRQGQLEGAIAELELAVQASAGAAVEPDARYALAETLLAAGRKRDAGTAAAAYLQLEHRAGQEARLARARQLAH